MVLITTIAIGSAVVLGSIGAFKFGQEIAGGSSGEVHYLGSDSIDPPSLLSIGLESVTSPFASIGNFLLDFLITPLVLIAFAILFFVAQYWLFKLYFGLGKKLFEGISKVMEKLNFSDNKENSVIRKITNFLDIDN